jgi:hypothetical protein
VHQAAQDALEALAEGDAGRVAAAAAEMEQASLGVLAGLAKMAAAAGGGVLLCSGN